MPLITLYIIPQLIHGFHNILIDIYREWKRPIHIDEGVNYEGVVDTTCAFITRDALFGEKVFKDFFHRAAYMMFHLNRGHPFTDGNKRTSLFAVYYFLRWNGYYLPIPRYDAQLFLDIANDERTDVTVSDAYVWILERVRCNPKTLLYHLSCLFFIGIARLVKDEEFSHFVSEWLFITSPPAFIQNIQDIPEEHEI